MTSVSGMKPPNNGDSGGGTAMQTSESHVTAEGKLSAEGTENTNRVREIKLEIKDLAQMRMLII